LPDSSIAVEITMGFAIDGNRKESRLQNNMYPIAKNIIEAKRTKNLKQEIPIQRVKGFGNVNFQS
jgi:hypothetical protein